jgi:hypothetical protein
MPRRHSSSEQTFEGRHHRSIDDTKTFGPENSEFMVDNATDCTGARRMRIRSCSMLDKCHDDRFRIRCQNGERARCNFVSLTRQTCDGGARHCIEWCVGYRVALPPVRFQQVHIKGISVPSVTTVTQFSDTAMLPQHADSRVFPANRAWEKPVQLTHKSVI